MRPTRRSVLRGGLAGAAALGGGLYFPPRRAEARPVDPTGTTLDSVVLRGPAGAGGWRPLVSGPGEPHEVRADLGGAPSAKRVTKRAAVAAFVQFTDVHVIDAQSPARVEFLDRYSDPPTAQAPFDSAYRPQEMFTVQIADAMARAINSIGRGPVTGKPLEFTMNTGDNIDNAQYNELRWFIDVLDGGTVAADSGDRSKWEGVHDDDPLTYDLHYWHPHGTPAGKADDDPRRLYGFPVIPGLLDAARRPFDAAGLSMKWYAAFGNHDPLLQGNAPVNAVFSAIATGGVKVVSIPAGLSPGDVMTGLTQQDPAVLNALLAAPARPVTPDPDRRPLTRAQWMAEYFLTTGSPVGHGFSRDNVATAKGYYAFDQGTHLRCVVLDTVNPGGYSEGSLDRAQFDWLKAELAAHSGPGKDRLVVLFSHHSIASMNNPIIEPGETQPRVLGDEVEAELLKWPNVVLWVNGHTHRNHVIPHPAPGGAGFWEVNTAAHVDWPAQSRILEITDNRDGTLSIFATMVDLLAPLAYGGSLASSTSLASLAREVAANDWQQRPNAPADPNEGGRRGGAEDRNVELVLPAPFPLEGARKETRPATRPRGDTKVLAATGPEQHPAGIAAALAVVAAGLAAGHRRATCDHAEHGRE